MEEVWGVPGMVKTTLGIVQFAGVVGWSRAARLRAAAAQLWFSTLLVVHERVGSE